ncbi:uncharacterized protein FPOAC1_013792 [Fusarium poae]|uniref:uncharacterized protein n=1 Tax=Fusarium poae TaxID=36050 RepID=UPI001D04EB27|nr:uncharacterized protein FPOAC1_013792 [Fusarium poae]KAG8664454.1 hypothetical protein FPOAC1_013792 [Fusarium poae]
MRTLRKGVMPPRVSYPNFLLHRLQTVFVTYSTECQVDFLSLNLVDTKAPHNWKTIALLIEEGADPWYRIRIGRGLFTYPQIATVMGNPEVAERLEEVAMEKPEDEETDVSSSC